MLAIVDTLWVGYIEQNVFQTIDVSLLDGEHNRMHDVGLRALQFDDVFPMFVLGLFSYRANWNSFSVCCKGTLGGTYMFGVSKPVEKCIDSSCDC